MPYDPLAPQALRDTLRTLIHHFKLTRQHIRDAAIAHRRQRGLSPVIPFIDRSTLGRFIAGDDIRNIEALGAIWDYLESVERYRPFLTRASDTADKSPDAELASGLARVFSAGGAVKPLYDLAEVRRRLAGDYLSYRVSQRRGTTRLYRTALIRITDRDDGASVTETRGYLATETDAAYRQTDRGFLFTHGRYVFLLMTDDNSIATVRLQVVTELMPWGGGEDVNYFCGESFTTSDRRVFPVVRFFCRRLRLEADPSESFITREFPLSELQDPVAVAFLRG